MLISAAAGRRHNLIYQQLQAQEEVDGRRKGPNRLSTAVWVYAQECSGLKDFHRFQLTEESGCYS